MDRLFRVLVILILFQLGILLVFLPWMSQWEQNWFLSRYPDLIKYLLHPATRGIISGLGVLDIAFAIGLLRRPQPAATR
jgi:hypothetical protein